MRGSRETELARKYPIHVVTSWLGNTVSIAVKHYLQVTDDDFARASGGGAKCGAQVAQNTAQHTRASNCMESPELKQTPKNTEFVQHQALVCATVQNVKSERGGFEPPVRCNPHTGFRNQLLQPLGHLSQVAWFSRLLAHPTRRRRRLAQRHPRAVRYASWSPGTYAGEEILSGGAG